MLLLRLHELEYLLGDVTEAEGAVFAVHGEEGGREFGEFACGEASGGIHLEVAFLGVDEALGANGIVECLGVDCGVAEGIAVDVHGGGEAGDSELALLVDACVGVVIGGAVRAGATGEGNGKGAEEAKHGGDAWVFHGVIVCRHISLFPEMEGSN